MIRVKKDWAVAFLPQTPHQSRNLSDSEKLPFALNCRSALFLSCTPAFKIFAKPGIGRTVDVVLPGRLRGADSYMNAVASTIRG
jgi:hypothetical protein